MDEWSFREGTPLLQDGWINDLSGGRVHDKKINAFKEKLYVVCVDRLVDTQNDAGKSKRVQIFLN